MNMMFLKCLGLAIALPLNIANAQQTCISKIVADTPSLRFTVNADGTVIDTVTRLMWKKCPEGQTGSGCGGGALTTYDWGQALTVAAASSFAGYTDWRAPDIKELHSIVERKCASPAINLAVFPTTPPGGFWTSSIDTFNPGYVHLVKFDLGLDSFLDRKTDKFYIRLVRNITP
jgi:Protein of unknown function (DUF1566)